MTANTRHPTPPAILLLGPTGSGKTPQGRLLGALPHVHHFDFGAELRGLAAAGEVPGWPPADLALIRRLVETHQLLPEDRFDIAARCLATFMERQGVDPARDVLVLNGLPRHLDQARRIADLVDIRWVVVLEAEPAVVAARVARRQRGEGLDDADRQDDSEAAVARKLAVYHRQTMPLVEHYEQQPGVAVSRWPVTLCTDDRALHRRIVAWLTTAGCLSASAGAGPAGRSPGGS